MTSANPCSNQSINQRDKLGMDEVLHHRRTTAERGPRVFGSRTVKRDNLGELAHQLQSLIDLSTKKKPNALKAWKKFFDPSVDLLSQHAAADTLVETIQRPGNSRRALERHPAIKALLWTKDWQSIAFVHSILSPGYYANQTVVCDSMRLAEIKERKPHGLGREIEEGRVLVGKYSDVYEGEFFEGKRHGWGKLSGADVPNARPMEGIFSYSGFQGNPWQAGRLSKYV